MQINKQIPAFAPALKSAARKSMILAADWAVRTQVRDAWPNWDANKGRYPYHLLIDPKKRAKLPIMRSTCWKTARAAQGMYSAALVTGRQEYLDSANLAMAYVGSLQFFEPGYEEFHGSFREDSPLGPHVAFRDGMEAVQGFIAGYLATGNERYLARAVDGTDFVFRNYDAAGKKLFGIAFPYERRFQRVNHFCFYAGAIIMAQMAALTGRKKYAKAAADSMDFSLKHHVRPDGALGVAPAGQDNHHIISKGELAGVFINDDGLGVALLSTYAVTGDERYLDAAVRAADFWAGVTEEPARLAVYPCVGLFLADVYRLTGDKKYLPMLERYTRKTIGQQCLKKDPMLHGCYIGEDMATHYDKKSKAEDYVDLRITSYALIHLAKVAATKPSQWSCAYSCFGW